MKKNKKYLSYVKQEDDLDYWELSEVNFVDQSGWCWTNDYEKAKYFMSKRDADIFLAKKKGDFWEGVEIVNE
ncbi:hypothetical protein M5F04_04935 [Acinetobacter sp. ANC 7200]|uniref:hypothetical protein n=1 Tax=Acinetobacter amyesii TaxID=2942470 RepID=UPI0020C0D02E|nr:hypothetical protein [Acinetobacter amyesii]MCL6243919.1 hypothetical protein [Acinetobacter amyesii]